MKLWYKFMKLTPYILIRSLNRPWHLLRQVRKSTGCNQLPKFLMHRCVLGRMQIRFSHAPFLDHVTSQSELTTPVLFFLESKLKLNFSDWGRRLHDRQQRPIICLRLVWRTSDETPGTTVIPNLAPGTTSALRVFIEGSPKRKLRDRS